MAPTHIKNQAHGVRVRWAPNDGLPAGIKITDSGNADEFVPWQDLLPEITLKLLPQMFADSRGWRFELRDFNGKKDWLVQVVDGAGDVFCDVWFGSCPPKWTHEGYVKVGVPDDETPVWQTYERYSDGSYRLKQSLLPTLDEKLETWSGRNGRVSDA